MSAKIKKEDLPELRRTKQMRVREVIEEVERFHERGAEVYECARDVALEDKAILLLEHLIEHQRRVAVQLKEYRAAAPAPVMETWFRYVREIPLENLVDSAEFDPDQGPDEIAGIAAELSDLLIEELGNLADSCAVDDVAEVMRNLRDLELREKIAALRSTEEP